MLGEKYFFIIFLRIIHVVPINSIVLNKKLLQIVYNQRYMWPQDEQLNHITI